MGGTASMQPLKRFGRNSGISWLVYRFNYWLWPAVARE